jgi:hypothetical protein
MATAARGRSSPASGGGGGQAAVRAPGRSSSGGARGVGPWAGAELPCSGRARRAARSRRHGGQSSAMVADSGRERVGEREEVIGELTVVRFEAEDGRERELDVGAKLDGDRQWRTSSADRFQRG